MTGLPGELILLALNEEKGTVGGLCGHRGDPVADFLTGEVLKVRAVHDTVVVT
jgi:hypothetical protein